MLLPLNAAQALTKYRLPNYVEKSSKIYTLLNINNIELPGQISNKFLFSS